MIKIGDEIGNNPYEHLFFLEATKTRNERTLDILKEIVTPRTSVLDLGTGALGIFALAAASLGSRRVVGVDIGEVRVARELAFANGLESRTQFISCDISSLELHLDPEEKFDIIIGYIYDVGPWRNIWRQKMYEYAITKYRKESTVLIPDGINYRVRGMGISPIRAEGTVNMSIDMIEEDFNLSLTSLRNLNTSTYKSFAFAEHHREWNDRKNFSKLTPLTESGFFDSIEMKNPSFQTYPNTFCLTAQEEGFLTKIEWSRSLTAGVTDLYTMRGVSRIMNPTQVRKGDVLRFRIDQNDTMWKTHGSVFLEKSITLP